MYLFQKKIDRVIKQKDQEKKFRQEREKLPLEKGDAFAMIVAAFLVFLPVVLLLIGAVFLIYFLMMGWPFLKILVQSAFEFERRFVFCKKRWKR